MEANEGESQKVNGDSERELKFIVTFYCYIKGLQLGGQQLKGTAYSRAVSSTEFTVTVFASIICPLCMYINVSF